MAAPAPPTAIATNALVAATKLMVHKTALEARRSKALTPYLASAWLRLLREADLDHKYPDLAHCIEFGFDAGIRIITSTFVPANSSTIENFHLNSRLLLKRSMLVGGTLAPSLKNRWKNSLVRSRAPHSHLSPKKVKRPCGWSRTFLTRRSRFRVITQSTLQLTPTCSPVPGARLQPSAYLSPVFLLAPRQQSEMLLRPTEPSQYSHPNGQAWSSASVTSRC